MGKLEITAKIDLSDTELFEWIETFFSSKRIKANKTIIISHDVTNELTDFIFKKLESKFNKSMG